MSRIKDWFVDHKEIILAGSAFLLGCIVTGAIERSRHSDLDMALKIYNRAVGYTNDYILPDLNKKYENIDFDTDQEAMNSYYTEHENAFNAAVVKELRNVMGINYDVTVSEI